ncbi:MAG TPA: deaminase, partial [Candidatus Cloacimonadota bacterium]|nr:deaminase [Candidatus Cloacimonadota bacterium]
GAVLVRNNQIISSGYNGTPKNISHCAEVGCMREMMAVPSGEKHELCRGVHAEQNAIIQATINGSSSQGAVLYCTNHPCSICAKMIINAEINTVYIADQYPDKLAGDLLSEAGIELIYVDPQTGNLSKLTS